ALHTIGDIAATPRQALERSLGAALGSRLHDLANGVDPRRVTTERIEKSLGHEHTFEVDVSDRAQLDRELLRLSTRVGARLRAGGIEAGTLALKLRFADFTTITRSRRLATPTDLGR